MSLCTSENNEVVNSNQIGEVRNFFRNLNLGNNTKVSLYLFIDENHEQNRDEETFLFTRDQLQKIRGVQFLLWLVFAENIWSIKGLWVNIAWNTTELHTFIKEDLPSYKYLYQKFRKNNHPLFIGSPEYFDENVSGLHVTLLKVVENVKSRLNVF